MSKKIEVIDLFCGAGGLSCGLIDAGMNVVAGLDIDPHSRYPYEENNHAQFIHDDITKYPLKNLRKYFSRKSIKVLVGCAPCQPFSSLAGRSGNSTDNRTTNLIRDFGNAIEAISPDIISVENVRRFENHKYYKKFLDSIKKMDYKYTCRIVYCPDYGVPQSRYRMVMLASKYGKIELCKPTHSKGNYVQVKDLIKRLPKLKAGAICPNDALHQSRMLDMMNLERIKASKPNGTWRDWDKRLLPECYKRKSGESFTSVYGRMSWDGLAPTITTQFYNYGSGRFGHPSQNRALSLREGALLQTFRNDYKFGPEITMSNTGRLIGNAVPPKLGKIIGESIINHIKEYKL